MTQAEKIEALNDAKFESCNRARRAAEERVAELEAAADLNESAALAERIILKARVEELERLGDNMLFADDFHIEESQEAWDNYRNRGE